MRDTPPRPVESDNVDYVAINNALTNLVFELPRLLDTLQTSLPNGFVENLLSEFNRLNRPLQRPVVTPNAVVLMSNRSRASKNKEQLSRAELVYLIIFLGIIKLLTSKHENHFIFNSLNLSALTPENLMLCLTLTLHVAPLILNAINEATMVPKLAPANILGIFSTLNTFLPLIHTFSPQALIPSRVDRGIKPKEENPTSEKAMVLYKPQQATGSSATPSFEEIVNALIHLASLLKPIAVAPAPVFPNSYSHGFR